MEPVPDNQKSFSLICFLITLLVFIIGFSASRAETNLTVNISPQGAVDDGAMWRYKEKGSSSATWSPWINSGDTRELFEATFYIEFKDTSSGQWKTPDTREVSIAENQERVVNQTYQPDNTATVTVNIKPVNSDTADARWSLYYSEYNPYFGKNIKHYVAQNLASGDTCTFEPQYPYQYYISSSFVTDLARPYDEAILVAPTTDHVINRRYKDLIVGCVHIFGNKLEYSDTRFKTSGTTRWAFTYANGSIESVRYIRCEADLRGTFSPARIKGKGTIHCNEDLGALEKMLSFFSDKTFYNGGFTLNADTLEAISTSNQRPIWDWVSAWWTTTDFKIYKNPVFGLNQTGYGMLDLPVFSEPSKVRFEEFKVYEQDSKPQITGDIIWEGATIEDWMIFHETVVHLDTTTKTFTAEGFDVEVLQEMPSFRGDIRVVDGVVRKLRAELYDIGLGIDDLPIEIDNCSFEFENPEDKSFSASIEGGMTLKIPETDIEVGTDTFEGVFDYNGYFSLRSERTILGYDIGYSETDIQWKGNYQYLQSGFMTTFYVGGYFQFLITGQGYLYVQWKPDFSFNGWISASGWIPLPDWLSWLTKSGQINLPAFMVKINSNGLLISVTLFDIYSFQITIPPFWDLDSNSNDSKETIKRTIAESTEFKSMNTSRAGDFDIPSGLPGFIVSFQKNGNAPDVVLIKPDGTEIDPLNYVNSGNGITVGMDDSNGVTGFMVDNPQSGTWKVRASNPDAITQRLIKGNVAPEILTTSMEKQDDGSYKLKYKAYDGDDAAIITFYNTQNCDSFMGKEIGTAREKDGPGSFIWTPGKDETVHRYICAVIDDGVNNPARAYFNGVASDTTAPKTPSLNEAYMDDDTLVLKLQNLNVNTTKTLKIYYSDDLETENFSDQFIVPAGTKVKIEDTPMIPGRKYCLCVTAVNASGVESKFSDSLELDYRLKHGNNYPLITSQPPLLALEGSRYEYQLDATDYDDDTIDYNIISGPDGMEVSDSGLLTWRVPGIEHMAGSLVEIEANDGNGGTDTQQYYFSVHQRRDTRNRNLNARVLPNANNQNMFISINNQEYNQSPGKIESYRTTVLDPNTGFEWTVILTETSSDSGVFKGLLPLEQGEILQKKNLESLQITRLERK